jgi:YD repeat-containing protein
MVLVCALPLHSQGTTTFQYFYDDGQLIKVIDSNGNQINYSYDPVGNLLQITRGAAPGSGTLAITNFTPQQGGAGTAVTIQGQGFSATPSADTVQFNGTPATVISATTTLVPTVALSATREQGRKIAYTFQWNAEAGELE